MRGALDHIDVIVSTGRAKKYMPNPKIIICHGLKYDTALFVMS